MATPASDSVVEAIADAIFMERPAVVVEAYSAPDQEPIEFHSAQDIYNYARSRRNSKGDVHLAVLYPDMAGKLVRFRIDLDPQKCKGHAYRYEARGWGLLMVYLEMSPDGKLGSYVSANSEKRALAWAPTYPEMEAPSTWHWPAVARHLRRLRCALKRAADVPSASRVD